MIVCLVVIFVLGSVHACPPGVTTFSADSGDANYFRCVDGEAVLSTCPPDSDYDRYSGKCIDKRATGPGAGPTKKKSGIVNSDALGRIVSLGTLYDARTDSIWNGFSMWSQKEIEANKMVQKQPYSKTKFFADKSFKDRVAIFSIDASMELSFMAGMIDVKGSAHYLSDDRSTNEKIRVNMDYYAITDTETIPHNTPVTFLDNCKYVGKEEGPTHVISSITHGLRAVFVFERTISNTSTAQEVSGTLDIDVKTIPSFHIKGSAVVNMNGTNVENIDNIEVRFYGDVILDQTPSNYINACKVFNEIPAKVKDTTTVVKFQMTPIKYYCGDTEVILRQINKNLIDQTVKVLEDFSTLERDCNSLTSTTVSHLFYSLRKSFNTFKEGLTRFSNNYKAELVEKLPKLKAGTISETELVTLLSKYHNSPFMLERAKIFLEAREREVKTIGFVIKEGLDNKNIEVTDSSTANDNTCIFDKEFTMIYAMYVLPKDDIAKEFLNGSEVDTGETKWFNDNAKIGYAGKVFKEFVRFANANTADNQCFLIQVRPHDENPSAMVSVVAMKNGVVISDNFKIPVAPLTPTCKDNGYDTIKLKTKIEFNPYIKSYLATYTSLQPDGNWTEPASKSIPLNYFKATSLNMLKPSTLYSIQLSHTTVTGHSQPSDIVHCKTEPSSEPTVLRAGLATQSSISLKWDAPKVIAPNLTHAYLLSIKKIDSGNAVILPDSGPTTNLEITLVHLQPSSLYEINVRFTHGEFEGPSSDVITVATAPVPPPELTLKQLAQNSVTVVTDLRGVKVAEGMKVMSLTLDYCKLDDKGIKPLPGTDHTRTIVVEETDDPIETALSDLAAGTTYSVKYKLTVSNHAGTADTEYNNAVIFTTGYEKSELEQFRESLGLPDMQSKIASQAQEMESVKSDVAKLHNGTVVMDFINENTHYSSKCRRVCSGQIYPKAEGDWKNYNYDQGHSVSGVLDMSKCGFVQLPHTTMSIQGASYDSYTIESPVSETQLGIGISGTGYCDEREGCQLRNNGEWYINWIAVGYSC